MPLPCWASSGVSTARDARHAGINPTTSPLAIDAKRPAASTGASMTISSMRGSVGGSMTFSVRTASAANSKPAAAADHGKTRPLGHQLANQPRSPRPQRRAQRQLALTGEIPRQEHAGDIRTGNEQDQRHRGEERQQRGAHALVEHRVGDPVDLHAPSLVRGRKLLLERSGDALHLVLRLADRDARTQPSDHANGVIAAVLTRRIDCEGHEHLRRGGRRHDRSPDVAKRMSARRRSPRSVRR